MLRRQSYKVKEKIEKEHPVARLLPPLGRGGVKTRLRLGQKGVAGKPLISGRGRYYWPTWQKARKTWRGVRPQPQTYETTNHPLHIEPAKQDRADCDAIVAASSLSPFLTGRIVLQEFLNHLARFEGLDWPAGVIDEADRRIDAQHME